MSLQIYVFLYNFHYSQFRVVNSQYDFEFSYSFSFFGEAYIKPLNSIDFFKAPVQLSLSLIFIESFLNIVNTLYNFFLCLITRK